MVQEYVFSIINHAQLQIETNKLQRGTMYRKHYSYGNSMAACLKPIVHAVRVSQHHSETVPTQENYCLAMCIGYEHMHANPQLMFVYHVGQG